MSQQRISQARTVVRHAPDLANAVLAGHLSLDNAYEEARLRKGQRAMATCLVSKQAAPQKGKSSIELRPCPSNSGCCSGGGSGLVFRW